MNSPSKARWEQEPRSQFANGAAEMLDAVEVPIGMVAHAYQVRRDARFMAKTIGFSATECDEIALVASELAMNLIRYARHGVIRLTQLEIDGRRGIKIQSRDEGPGIADLTAAMVDGFSTGGGLGGGLSGVRRLVDDFEIDSSPSGTNVVGCKWLKVR